MKGEIMGKILIVDSETPIADLLAYGFEKEGFQCEVLETGGEFLRRIKKNKIDLVVLEWDLPDCSGIDICKLLNEEFNVPVIIITSRNDMDDKILALSVGADDYIIKPFEVREIIARTKAILSRISKINVNDYKKIEVNDIVINKEEKTVTKGGDRIEVTPKEFELLSYFINHPNKVFTREVLLEKVWGYEYSADTRTVDTHVQRLRKKVNLNNQIQTVFGVGYKYVPK